MCKMEKVTTFTQFEQKITHISGCKLVYKYTIATVIVHICTVTVACVFIILLISCSHIFFSLFSMHNELSDFSSPHLFFPQMHTNTQTHPHRQINIEIHKHTHTQTNPHRQTNREIDRCLTGTISACGSFLIGACESCLIGAWPRGSGDWVLFEEWVWVLLVLQWRCLIFILNERGREGARESEGFEMVVKLFMEI